MEGNEYYRHGEKDYSYGNDSSQIERITRENAETMYFTQRANKMIGEGLEKSVLKKPRRRKKISEPMLKKYRLLVRKTNEQELNPEAIFVHIPEKRSLFREIMGYTKLQSVDGKISLDSCSDSQIGKAFKNTYRSAVQVIR